mmetsp:Transcript_10438/g.32127  ORF Transcript_10438/g.32127 Transcript_10438/m.32127 type:complete len:90 (-) Transcript_10438:183-452(-)|eukprot:scaffold109069_cov31-Tisochrysis_lutea.AAC.8
MPKPALIDPMTTSGCAPLSQLPRKALDSMNALPRTHEEGLRAHPCDEGCRIPPNLTCEAPRRRVCCISARAFVPCARFTSPQAAVQLEA